MLNLEKIVWFSRSAFAFRESAGAKVTAGRPPVQSRLKQRQGTNLLAHITLWGEKKRRSYPTGSGILTAKQMALHLMAVG